jgi:hypothetical protein
MKNKLQIRQINLNVFGRVPRCNSKLDGDEKYFRLYFNQLSDDDLPYT